MDRVLLSSPEPLTSFLEFLQYQLEVLLHGLTKLLLHQGFCVIDRLSLRLLGLLIVVWLPPPPPEHGVSYGQTVTSAEIQ